MGLERKFPLGGKLLDPWLRGVEPYLRWGLGRTGERAALALLVLAFYATVFFLIGLVDPSASGVGQPMEGTWRLAAGGWGRCFLGLAACYGVAFFAIASGYFWSRWFGAGLAASGALTAVLAMITAGYNPALLTWGLTHGSIWLLLAGGSMAERYDGQPGWRARWHVDDDGVDRVRKAVTRAAAGLPSLIAYALAPRTEHHCLRGVCVDSLQRSADGYTLLAWVALLLAVGAVVALLARRTVGVVLLVGSGVAALVGAVHSLGQGIAPSAGVHWLVGPLAAVVSTLLLGAALAPLAAPVWRAVRRLGPT
jgi:hypothetical protein